MFIYIIHTKFRVEKHRDGAELCSKKFVSTRRSIELRSSTFISFFSFSFLEL